LPLLLLISVFVIATCGLIYELIAGTLASYLLGDSITQFSTIIGTYLFAMGIGSWLSQHVHRNLLGFFIRVEILVGLIGGSSAAFLFLLFDHVYSFRFLLYFTVTVIGILVGIEIPILLRLLKDRFEFKDLVSRVFTFDYIGALFASILFPLVLVPHLGLVRSSFMFGILNVGVALWLLYALKEPIPWARSHKAAAITVLVILTMGFAYSDKLSSIAETGSFAGHVVYAKSTPYQRIVITRQKDDVRLYLNSNLQFSSQDEYRYHEALVHPVMAALPNAKRVLIIGGGDGLALREVLKYPNVQQATLVDLDPAMTKLFSSSELLRRLNGDALRSQKLKVVNADAFLWLKMQQKQTVPPQFDAVIVDLPDPSNFSIGKLYTTSFYRMLHKVMTPDALAVVQSTSPLVARKSFWCIDATLRASGFETAPYHALVPAFGDWGYIIAGRRPYRAPETFPTGLRFIEAKSVADMFHFPPDMARVKTEVQRLDNQALIHYFDEEWSKYLIY
jgi:spermidine synthase